MIKNMWSNTQLLCGNHKEGEEKQMEIQQGPHSLFYACPCYAEKYKPEEERTEKCCNNRLNLIDYEKMVSHISSLLENTDDPFADINLENYSWKAKGVEYKILSHSNNRLRVRMLNKTAIMS